MNLKLNVYQLNTEYSTIWKKFTLTYYGSNHKEKLNFYWLSLCPNTTKCTTIWRCSRAIFHTGINLVVREGWSALQKWQWPLSSKENWNFSYKDGVKVKRSEQKIFRQSKFVLPRNDETSLPADPISKFIIHTFSENRGKHLRRFSRRWEKFDWILYENKSRTTLNE